MIIGGSSREHTHANNGHSDTVESVMFQEHSSETADFSAQVEGAGDTAVVVAAGELDLHTAPRLSDALTEGESPGVKLVTVDLAGVTFIDSTGLRVLVACSRRLRAA